MINKLKEIEQLLPEMLNQDIWNTLDVDYHPPRVERVWTQLDENRRLLLHIIHPCETEEALVHPHPWKSAIHVLNLPGSGTYEHGIGAFNPFTEEETIMCTQEVSGDMYYEMLNPAGIHYVRPIGKPSFSVMLTERIPQNDHEYDMWSENDIKSNSDLFDGLESMELKPLTDMRKVEILRIFRSYFACTK